MKHKSNISIDVVLDENRMPEDIIWKASDSTADMDQRARAMMLAFWDAADKSALRIDLWTKDMMVDEMAEFYYQVFMTMADTFTRATRMPTLSEEMKDFARNFMRRFRDEQNK
ncbi:MAG: gliding motility protein GldC [Lacibacter sp.]